MSLEPKDIRFINKFYIDGKSRELGTSNINYIGFVHSPFDITIPADSADNVINLENKGAIKCIIIQNRSTEPAYFKLDGSSERYKIIDQTIISQHPDSLLIDNDSLDKNIVLEVTIVGEEN